MKAKLLKRKWRKDIEKDFIRERNLDDRMLVDLEKRNQKELDKQH